MSALVLLALLAAELPLAAPMHRQDAPLPPQPPIDALQAPIQPHALGEGVTVYVNFDGVQLTECNPSDSRRDCSWYNFEEPFPPFSGTVQTQVGVLQAMRSDVADFGIRVTGTRPESGNYTMVVYGGTEAEYGALGSAPSGDCDDEVPNQIAFAHLDGETNAWVNGGATTSLHEAGHTWGLDHIDFEGAIMFPSGDNSPTYFRDLCDQVVDDTDLNPGDAACPHLNLEHCGDANFQNATARLTRLFGPPYVDMEPPVVELLEPEDGQYFQAPATFDVVFDTRDDLHPQAYSVWAWLGDDPRPADASKRVDPGFSVTKLPIGTWDFHVVVADEAGNETRVDFTIEVGEDPPPDPAMNDQGCACRSGSGGGVGWAWWICVPVVLARRRRWR